MLIFDNMGFAKDIFMTEGASKEWNKILTGLKNLIKERNEKFGLEGLTGREERNTGLKNMKKVKKTSKPSEGIWFWVWLKPRWELDSGPKIV
jgi:hypothetical protein